jgi:hypothetical protein
VAEAEHRDRNADLARAAGELLTLASTSESRAMNRLVELAARHVQGCSGATAVLWHDGEPMTAAASHPDMSELDDVQQTYSRGPVIDALAEGVQVRCDDTLTEARWPEYANKALSLGVRCSVTLIHQAMPLALTLTLYATRPRLLDASRLPLPELLIAFGGVAVHNNSAYEEAQRTARQLSESADSRAIVDQAKGILMAGMSLSAEEALAKMRQLSQAHQLKVSEVAKRIIESHELDLR